MKTNLKLLGSVVLFTSVGLTACDSATNDKAAVENKPVTEEISEATNTVVEIAESVKAKVVEAAPAVKDAVVEMAESTKDKVAEAVPAIKEAVVEMAEDAKEKVAETVPAIKEAVVEMAEDAKEKVAETVPAIKEAVVEMAEDAKEKVAETVPAIKEAVAEMAEDAKEKVEDLKDKVVETAPVVKEMVTAKVEEAKTKIMGTTPTPAAIEETAPVAMVKVLPAATEEVAPVAMVNVVPAAMIKAVPAVMEKAAPAVMEKAAPAVMEKAAPAVMEKAAPVALEEVAPVVSEFKEGTHYFKIFPTMQTDAAEGKIEVVELFWLACPHCFALEPTIKSYKKSLPDYVEFKQVPAMLNPRWAADGKTFYIAEILDPTGELKLVDKLFNAIHIQKRKRMASPDVVKSFIMQQGISEADYDNAAESMVLTAKLNRARQVSGSSQATSVPTLIINGKYRTSPHAAGNEKKMMQIVDMLTKRELDK